MLVHNKTRFKVGILKRFNYKYYKVNIQTKVLRYMFLDLFLNGTLSNNIKNTYPYKF